MKRFWNWQVLLVLILLAASFLVYALHYLIFHDLHHIFLYLIGDIAFVFIEVLLVTVVIQSVLNFRERQALLKKLNMVIGTFFIEVGTQLLSLFSCFDPQLAEVAQKLVLPAGFSQQECLILQRQLKQHTCLIDFRRGDLSGLKNFLVGKRAFLLSLLRNPNLLEHASFTDLLWAVFHLAEELQYRRDVKSLPEADYRHLAHDAQRAYKYLLVAWLEYMQHLKVSYPYLFSLAIRTNPFDRNASVEIKR